MAAPRPVALTALLWICSVLAAWQFALTGYAKLTGDPAMVRVFAAVGFGQWFRYVTGTIEVVGAVLLFVPPVAAVGAALLMMTMAGALIAHATVLPFPPYLPLGLLVLVTIVFWVRWRERSRTARP